MASTTSRVPSCTLALLPTPAPSLLYLKEGATTASPSCLGGSWLSAGGGMVPLILLLLSLTAYLGLQATPAGLFSTT